MSHDYDPSWDYPVTELNDEDVKVLAMVQKEIIENIMPALGFKTFSVFFVDENGFDEGTVGMYIDGTNSSPVVGLDINQLKLSSDEIGIDWIDQVRATIIHELAHAYQESLGDDNMDEDAAETFARRYVMDGIVDIKVFGGEAPIISNVRTCKM